MDDLQALYGRGFVLHRGAFARAWVAGMEQDIWAAFGAARARPGGVVPRGPQRWYVEMHPEQLRGFVELVTHPWVHAVSEAMLGPDYEIVEIGFDIPFPGAEVQPWHRDFPSTPETWQQRRLTSLAFNLTAVDTTPEMGAFEIAPGTQWEDGLSFTQGMFPDPRESARYEGLAVPLLPQMGDITARSALTVHRGTPNRSASPRPWLVLGVDAPGAGHGALHDVQITHAFREGLPEQVLRHLRARVVDRLEPIVQKHQIEGLIQ